jgi:hypothetical protein
LGRHHSTVSHALQENLPRVQVCEKVAGESLHGYRRAVKAIEEGADFGEEFASNEAEVQANAHQFIHWSGSFFDWSESWSAEERIELSIILISIRPEKTRKKIGMSNGFCEIHEYKRCQSLPSDSREPSGHFLHK